MAFRRPRGSGTRPIPADHIERAIVLMRGERVMLDADLAKLYMVETRMLLQAV
ncbi:MAG: ORF6N domain-containing protein, partial [Candidatus Methylomirabilota bacterium]